MSSNLRGDDGQRLLCACCHGDGGWMTFGLVTERSRYPSTSRVMAVCGFSGWCPVLDREPIFPSEMNLPKESCALFGRPDLCCGRTAIHCKCTVGEVKMQGHIAKGVIQDVPRYERLRDRAHGEIRRRLAWESGRPATEQIPVDTSAANSVSLAMIKKFGVTP